MISSGYGKKSRASHCSDVTSMLRKGFYRILVVDEVKNDDIHGKVTKDL